ncbi:MAG TPA: pyrroline-5-carboxylate reductase [Flavitalea sp.]|nr:pyrroline-5-carboxylate reductase [Flavitalea sp.]
MARNKIAIIGGGNLGAAIAEGLIVSQFASPSDIIITRRNTAALSAFREKGALTISDNREAAEKAGIVILAIKPFQVKEVVETIREKLTPGHILVSVVTGVLIRDIEGFLDKKIPVFRAMPNTAIAIRESMTCLSAANASAEQVKQVHDLFAHLGKVAPIDEKLMDAATVLGASGTAFAMRYVRANIQGGVELGFDAATAGLIAAQTAKGAAELLLQKGSHPEYEIDKVATPKGCTIAGLNEMEYRGFSSSLIRGLLASFNKIIKG